MQRRCSGDAAVINKEDLAALQSGLAKFAGELDPSKATLDAGCTDCSPSVEAMESDVTITGTEITLQCAECSTSATDLCALRQTVAALADRFAASDNDGFDQADDDN